MTSYLKNIQLNNMWLTGFCDAEACFHVSFTKRLYRKIKIEVRPSFSITQLSRSKFLLFDIEKFFECGSIRFSKQDGCYRYEVRSLSDLNTKVIPFFEKNPLLGPKKEDFRLFQEVCCLMKENKDKNSESLAHIIEISFLINHPGKRKYTKDELLKLVSR
jgi:hypothetical protein